MALSLEWLGDIKRAAVIGASAKTKYMFLEALTTQFKGESVAIKPGTEEIEGFPGISVYPSVRDVPGALDFVFISVPRESVLQVIQDCVEKGVKLVSIFTAEFSDSNTEEGRELEQQIVDAARGSTRILGPNCMGIYYPRIGLGWRIKFPLLDGKTTLICQSGGISNLIIYGAGYAGLGIAKAFSFGNGADLHFVELLDYAVHDPETSIIVSYVEGIRDAEIPRLREILAENRKPFIAVKAGKSGAGSRASVSHTGSLAGSFVMWQSLAKQYGVIQGESFDDMLYLPLALDAFGAQEVQNIAVASMSGGYGVIMADLVESAGLSVPSYSPDLTAQLEEYIHIAGTRAKNPTDISSLIAYPDMCYHIFETIFAAPEVDAVIFDLAIWYLDPEYQYIKDEQSCEKMANAFALAHKYHKSFYLVIQNIGFIEIREKMRGLLNERHVPIFNSVPEVVHTIVKINEWIRFQKKKWGDIPPV